MKSENVFFSGHVWDRHRSAIVQVVNLWPNYIMNNQHRRYVTGWNRNYKSKESGDWPVGGLQITVAKPLPKSVDGRKEAEKYCGSATWIFFKPHKCSNTLNPIRNTCGPEDDVSVTRFLLQKYRRADPSFMPVYSGRIALAAFWWHSRPRSCNA